MGRTTESTAANRFNNNNAHSVRKFCILPFGTWQHLIINAKSNSSLRKIQLFSQVEQRFGFGFRFLIINSDFHVRFCKKENKEAHLPKTDLDNRKAQSLRQHDLHQVRGYDLSLFLDGKGTPLYLPPTL